MEQKNVLVVVLVLAGLGVGGLLVWKQFGVPTFEGMPAEIGNLTTARTTCVSRVQAVKKWAKPKLAAEGKTLYQTAQARVNGCITTIDLGLDSGFDATTMHKLRVNLVVADRECAAFVAWCDRNKPPEWGGSSQALPAWVEDLLQAVPNAIGKLYDDFQRQNVEQRKTIRDALEAAKFPDWDTIR